MELSKEQLEHLKRVELEILIRFDAFCKEHGLLYYLEGGTLLGAVRHKGFIPWDDDIDIDMPLSEYRKLKSLWAKEHPDGLVLQDHATDSNYFAAHSKIRLEGTSFVESTCKYPIKENGIFIDIFLLGNGPDDEKVFRKIKNRVQWYSRLRSRAYLSAKTGLKQSLKNVLTSIRTGFLKPVFAIDKMLRIQEEADKKYVDSNSFINLGIWAPLHLRKEWFSGYAELEFEGYLFPVPSMYDEVLRNEYGDYMQLPPEKERVPRHECVELGFGRY